MIFVDVCTGESPRFYVLTNQDWQKVLKKIKKERVDEPRIVRGALEWNWKEKGKPKKRRGSELHPKDIEKFKNNWRVLPGSKKSSRA